MILDEEQYVPPEFLLNLNEKIQGVNAALANNVRITTLILTMDQLVLVKETKKAIALKKLREAPKKETLALNREQPSRRGGVKIDAKKSIYVDKGQLIKKEAKPTLVKVDGKKGNHALKEALKKNPPPVKEDVKVSKTDLQNTDSSEIMLNKFFMHFVKKLQRKTYSDLPIRFSKIYSELYLNFCMLHGGAKAGSYRKFRRVSMNTCYVKL